MIQMATRDSLGYVPPDISPSRVPENMATFLVEGGIRLSGRIRPAGNKNAALPCLAATVLANEPVVLENVPRIRDVETFVEIVVSLGATAEWPGPNEVTGDPRGIQNAPVVRALAEKSRAYFP